MPSLKQWLKDRLKPGKQPVSDSIAKPPPLPYHDAWPAILAATGNSATNYGLFARLPLELRQRILTDAFGHRTLHVDLAFNHPLTRKLIKASPPLSRPVQARVKQGKRTHCGFGCDLVRDTSQPRAWQWFSCVCHRRLVRVNDDVRKDRIEPCDDGCIPERRIGRRVAQTAWEGSLCRCESEAADCGAAWAREGCFIGVVGWLLACRQSYLDGIDVLYKTNTFHFSSLSLLQDLPRLLPPHRLGVITSLELLWIFDKPNILNDDTINSTWASAAPSTSSTSSSRSSQETAFHTLCTTLPQIFPAVRRLYIALQAHIAPPHTFHADDDAVADVERVILGPVEGMFRRMGTGSDKEFSLAIQRGGWEVFADRLTEQGDGAQRVFEGFEDGSYQERAWKPLDDKGNGYWLRPGWDDIGTFGAEYWMYDLWRTGERRRGS
ncbi:hypothetical protein VTI74DRAFT_1716 [Chaetomium olivicolor]